MKRMIFASALMGLFCFVGCDSKPEVKAPDKDKVSAQPVSPASMDAGGGGKKNDGQTESQSIKAEE